ncbi:MAG TPA: hypothetical protein VGJ06_19730 [Candidatus Acidoferrum sp.]|jgi:hypothetical protein
MTYAKKYLVRLGGGLLLAASLVPMIVPTVQAQSVDVRVYDSHHRDYHNWNDRENESYRRYLAEQHWKYKEYQRQSHRRQEAYWEWRHSHPD